MRNDSHVRCIILLVTKGSVSLKSYLVKWYMIRKNKYKAQAILKHACIHTCIGNSAEL